MHIYICHLLIADCCKERRQYFSDNSYLARHSHTPEVYCYFEIDGLVGDWNCLFQEMVICLGQASHKKGFQMSNDICKDAKDNQLSE